MPIVTSQLIMAPMLQDYLVDKTTGEALVAGVVTMYKDSSRTVLKNWYYQSGTYPNYTYLTLPNPLTLSAVGTIQDDNGNDQIPFYYPFSETDNTTREAYYVTVYDSNNTLQFTRQNFPFAPPSSGTGNPEPNLKNLIINNRFWRAGSPSDSIDSNGWITIPLTNQTDVAVCPSQHDGFSMPDIRFIKNVTGADDQAIFKKFNSNEEPFTDAIRPEYYLNHTCTSISGSETVKKYQIPISLHIATLSGVEAIMQVWLKVNGGNANSQVTAKILQYMGSGAGNSSNFESTLDTYTATSAWKPYQSKFTFPSTLGDTYDSGGIQDSAFYLELELQTNKTLNICIAIPSIFLGDTVPTTDFASYDEIDTIINSWRTGDYRHSLNSSQPGWVAANDGTIGKQGSGATTRANPDTWPLYNLIWNNVSRAWSPLSAGTAGTAALDFSAGTTIALTKNLGRVMQGLDPVFVTPSTFTASVSTLNVSSVSTVTDQFTLASPFTFFTGQPIQFNATGTLPRAVVPGGDPAGVGSNGEILTANTTYYAIFVDANNIKLAFTLADAIAGNAMDICDAGVQPNTIINTNNVLTLATSQSPVLKAGTAVWLTNSGGGLPSGLSTTTIYYITTRSLAATTITLSDNLTDALNGYPIPILSNGTGTQTVNNALGSYSGSGYTTDVARHSHVQNIATTYDRGALNVAGAGTRANTDSARETYLEGIEKVSIIQPSAYTNVFLKL